MTAQTDPVEVKGKSKLADTEKYRGMAILAYIIFFIPLLTDAKNSPYVKFHVKQGLLLFLASIVVSILGSTPILGWLIMPLGSLLVLVLSVIGILHAVNGEQKEVPIIGKYAEQWFKF